MGLLARRLLNPSKPSRPISRPATHRQHTRAREHDGRTTQNAPAGRPPAQLLEANALHALLALRPDALEGRPKNSEEARELKLIAEALEAYEAIRWPDGKAPSVRGRIAYSFDEPRDP